MHSTGKVFNNRRLELAHLFIFNLFAIWPIRFMTLQKKSTHCVYLKTPVGETKMPDPTMVPTMIPTPFNRVIFRSRTTLCWTAFDVFEPFNLSLVEIGSSVLSFNTPVSLLFSLFFSLDMIDSILSSKNDIT